MPSPPLSVCSESSCFWFFGFFLLFDYFFGMGRGPDEFGSIMSEGEMEMAEEWFFPQRGFRLEPARPGDRITRPPPGQIGVYLETLWAGLRFPLHEFVNELLVTYQLVPAQLAPNAWRTIIGFLSLCLLHGIPSSVNVFRWCFLLKSNPEDGEWLYIALRSGRSFFRSGRTWGFDPR